jgi:hypothetical protein
MDSEIGGKPARPSAASTASMAIASFLLAFLGVACGPESYLPIKDGAVVDRGPAEVTSGGDDGPAHLIDFESPNLDSWGPVGNQRPPDVQDRVELSTAAHHHGASSLAMIYDGSYTPLTAVDGSTAAPYYGVYTGFDPPSPGAIVTMWVMSTVSGVSVQIYAQTMPNYDWNVLGQSDPLVPNTWTKVTITMPTAAAFYLGCQVNSALDIHGSVYLDDISW